MEYIDLCKYIFKEQVVDWELHNIKGRRRELIMAQYISMYLGNWFFPSVNGKELAKMFGKSRADGCHALKTIRNLLFTDKELRKRIDKYLLMIRRQITDETQGEEARISIEVLEPIARLYCELTDCEITKRQHSKV